MKLQPRITPELLQPSRLKLLLHHLFGKPVQSWLKLDKNRNVHHECLVSDTTLSIVTNGPASISNELKSCRLDTVWFASYFTTFWIDWIATKNSCWRQLCYSIFLRTYPWLINYSCCCQCYCEPSYVKVHQKSTSNNLKTKHQQ